MNKKDIEKKCNCNEAENEKCTCEQECNCENNCNCQEECTCGEECGCHEKACSCEGECNCTEENNCGCIEKNEIDGFKEKIKMLEDTVLRSQAELLNYKKRKDEETARIIKYAEEDILKGFLPILDNFERAISMDDNNFGDETSKFLEGFRMVYTQTKNLLEKFEVKEIDCLGQEFDPTYEQAISTVKREDKKPGVVVEIYQKGYLYKDRILRTAMVIVSE